MPRIPFHIMFATAITVSSLGCGQSDHVVQKQLAPEKESIVAKPKVPPKRVSNRPPNVNGSVFIAEYHHIREGKTTMERSPTRFRKDLERLYRLGFRPINVTEYLSGEFDLPPGASPVILSFDDAHQSQVRFRADGALDPNCGLGILVSFAKEHPDFPAKATFFVLPQLWGQPEYRTKKIELIKSFGGEVANHTMTHPNLAKLSDEQVKKEIGGSFTLLRPFKANPEYLALPLGVSPKNKSLLNGFLFKGETIKLKAVFLVGANPAPPTSSPKFDAYRIPRIQACEGPYGLDDWLSKLEKGQVKPYVAP